MKTGIEKIVLNVNNKKIELTTDEAKELKQILSDLFGGIQTQVVHEYHDRYWPYHNWHPYSYSYGTFTAGSIGIGSSNLCGTNTIGDTVYLSNQSVGETQNA